jgi:hypothetical protein
MSTHFLSPPVDSKSPEPLATALPHTFQRHQWERLPHPVPAPFDFGT